MPIQIGQRLGSLGQYEIIALLGAGGMATVYRARQTAMKREVAIKVIESRLAHNADFIVRFEREAQTIATLSHPHILKVFDYGQHDAETIYLVMELFAGGSLAELIRHHPLTPDEATRMIDQIAAALDYAHDQGVIHRDLKPQNILLDARQNAILTDFGIAKLLNETTGLTASGVALGTPAYMSPEQWRGAAIDGRTDIYAFGIMAFEMLSGRVPFKADTPFAMMYAHVNEPPPPVTSLRADLPFGVNEVIRIALAKEPARRYQSASAFATAFRAALAEGTPASPPTDQTPMMRPSRLPNRPLLFGISAVVAIMVFLTGLILLPPLLESAHTATPTPTETPYPPAPTSPAVLLLPMSPTTTTVTLPPTATKTITATETEVVFTQTLLPMATATQLPPPNTATSNATPTLDDRAIIAATIERAMTLTANVVASFTRTPTNMPTVTPHHARTIAAAVAQTSTAIAVASFTQTAPPTHTFTPTQRPTFTDISTPIPIRLSFPALTPRTFQVFVPVYSAVFSPDERYILTGSKSGKATLWNAQTGDAIHSFDANSGPVNAVAFSPDGRYVLTGNYQQTAVVWDAQTYAPLHTFSGHTASVNAVAFSPDGRYALTGSDDNTAILWDVQSGQRIHLFQHSQPVYSVVFSPDNRYALTGSADKSAILWDTQSGSAVRTFRANAAIYSVAISPDSRYILTGSADNTAILWDMQNGTQIRALNGHSGTVYAVAFSPNGSYILTGSYDHTMIIWDTGSGTRKQTLAGHLNAVTDAIFSSDGKYILSSSWDDTARLWTSGVSG